MTATGFKLLEDAQLVKLNAAPHSKSRSTVVVTIPTSEVTGGVEAALVPSSCTVPGEPRPDDRPAVLTAARVVVEAPMIR